MEINDDKTFNKMHTTCLDLSLGNVKPGSGVIRRNKSYRLHYIKTVILR